MVSKRNILAIVFILLAVVLGGCDKDSASSTTLPAEPVKNEQQQSQPPSSQEKTATAVGQENMIVAVYSATKDAMYLVRENYVVPKNDHPMQTAIELLIAGTKNSELVSVVPAGTKLRQITIKDKIAYVDFSEQIIKNSAGGASSEMLLVAAIVNTVTEFHNIQKVQILVEGKNVETLFGYMDIGEPLSRSAKIIKK